MTKLKELHGTTTDHLIDLENSPYQIHRDTIKMFKELQRRASSEGIDLRLVSAFRSFEDQQKIWNNKATGKRKLLDSCGNTLDYDSLSPEEIVENILRWSALPGFSRHHWGTDLDVYDHAALPDSTYKVKLEPFEYEQDGIFHKLTLWLDENMKDSGFYRPYSKDLGGVAPELWHISHDPISSLYLEEYNLEEAVQFLSKHKESLELHSIVEAKLEEILERFVLKINPHQ